MHSDYELTMHFSDNLRRLGRVGQPESKVFNLQNIYVWKKRFGCGAVLIANKNSHVKNLHANDTDVGNAIRFSSIRKIPHWFSIKPLN